MSTETCGKCGETIRWIQMRSSARWSSEKGNTCSHTPANPEHFPEVVWSPYLMRFVEADAR